MHNERLLAERRCRALRAEARAIAEPDIQEATGFDVRLSDITPEAIEIAASWSPLYTGTRAHHRPGWAWDHEVRRFRRRPRRVELAIWVDKTLCGLVLGRISDRHVVATIHFIESSPATTPLSHQIAPIATRYLDILATVAGCQEVAIERPVDGLVEFYQELGYDRATIKGQRVLRLKKSLKGL